MTQEALKLALDALENHTAIKHPQQIHYRDKAITAIKEALAQEQEPVGDDWTPCMKLPVVVYVRKQRFGESHVSTREGITPVKPDDLIMRGVSGEEYPIDRAIFEQTYSLNTAPPQRTEHVREAYASIKMRVGNMRVQQFITQEMLHNVDDPWRLITIYAEQCIEELKEKNSA